MSTSDSPTVSGVRHDGWTAERQLAFLDALAHSRSVTAAAATSGMTRESAYRLRARKGGGLFAALWDRALAFEPAVAKVHGGPIGTGQLMRLLGNHYRQKRGDFLAIGSVSRRPREP